MFFFLVGLIVCTPVIGLISLSFVSKYAFSKVRYISNSIGLITFIEAIILFCCYNQSLHLFQFVISVNWSSFLNGYFVLGVDSFSIFFLLLSSFINCCCFLACWSNKFDGEYKFFYICFLFQEFILHFVFVVLDILLFYIFFESVLVTMFFIIGVFGSRERKIRATYMLFLYTLGGSVLMLLTILFIFIYTGTTDYLTLLTVTFDFKLQKILWLVFFLAFAVKVPMMPFHIWLPEAHVEAPTVGSVILAGILLKMGTYGFLRFAIPLFPYASIYFVPFIFTISIISLIFASLNAIRQTDIKRVIAYSSIAHMNLIMIGLFSFDFVGLTGSFMQMLSHGLVSGGLFLLVGVVYDRYHTRLIAYYGGLVQGMPWFTFFFLIFTLANIALPGTSSFVGEFLIFLGTFGNYSISVILAATGMVLGGIYSLWLFNRICFGNFKFKYITELTDMSKREFFLFSCLLVLIIIIGIVPTYFLNYLAVNVGEILCLLFFNV